MKRIQGSVEVRAGDRVIKVSVDLRAREYNEVSFEDLEAALATAFDLATNESGESVATNTITIDPEDIPF